MSSSKASSPRRSRGGVRLRRLRPDDRAPLEAILRATGVFSLGEVEMALELIDEGLAGQEGPDPYRFLVAEERVRESLLPPLGGGWVRGENRTAAASAPHLASPREAGGGVCRTRSEAAAGAVVGYACYGTTPGGPGTYDLYWIAIAPARQGRGIGKILLAAVEEIIAREGGERIVVETSSRADYGPTRAFYERTGYAEESRTPDFYASGDDKVTYVKRV